MGCYFTLFAAHDVEHLTPVDQAHVKADATLLRLLNQGAYECTAGFTLEVGKQRM